MSQQKVDQDFARIADLRFVQRATENRDREARVVAEWERHELAILAEANVQQAVADLCLMCGAIVEIHPETLVARVSLSEPTRPLCSTRCDTRYQNFEAGR